MGCICTTIVTVAAVSVELLSAVVELTASVASSVVDEVVAGLAVVGAGGIVGPDNKTANGTCKVFTIKLFLFAYYKKACGPSRATVRSNPVNQFFQTEYTFYCN